MLCQAVLKLSNTQAGPSLVRPCCCTVLPLVLARSLTYLQTQHNLYALLVLD